MIPRKRPFGISQIRVCDTFAGKFNVDNPLDALIVLAEVLAAFVAFVVIVASLRVGFGEKLTPFQSLLVHFLYSKWNARDVIRSFGNRSLPILARRAKGRYNYHLVCVCHDTGSLGFLSSP